MPPQTTTSPGIRTRMIMTSVVAWLATMASTPIAIADPQPPQPAPGYLPSISDFMIATIQPRHIRLWLAAQRDNWEFAAFERENLQGAFGRLGNAHPVEDEIPFRDMIAAVTEQPLADIDAAIKAKDQTAFSKAYSDLTSACNACHQATTHGMVAIKVPSNASVFDQEFAPAAQ